MALITPQAVPSILFPVDNINLQPDEKLTFTCPGLYCGKIALGDGNYSQCGACPRGYRPDAKSICTTCTDLISAYDWMYLLFMAMIPLIVNLSVVDLLYRKSRNRYFAFMLLLVISEFLLASIITLVVFGDNGTLKIRSCGVSRLSDWYSIFYNPTPDYISSIRCAQEIVFPLYSMLFVYIFFSLLFMLIFRGIIARIIWSPLATNSLLACLYQYPILVILHAALAGIIHMVFPYIAIISSVISSTVHFTVAIENSGMDMMSQWNQWKKLLGDIHRLCVTIVHWLILAFGILSLLHFLPPRTAVVYLPLIACPTLVFLLTLRFTDPKKFFNSFSRS